MGDRLILDTTLYIGESLFSPRVADDLAYGRLHCGGVVEAAPCCG